MMKQVKIIVLRANIAAGKTTLLDRLGRLPSIKKLVEDGVVDFLEEPVQKWTSFCDKDGISIFELFYNDQAKWSFAFQLFALSTRCRDILEKVESNNNLKVLVIERSPDDDRFIFAELLHDMGFVNDMELGLIDFHRSVWYNQMSSAIYNTIYLDVDVEECISRLKKRSRDGECGISRDYLAAVQAKTDALFASDTKGAIRINCNCNLDDLEYNKNIDIIGKLITDATI